MMVWWKHVNWSRALPGVEWSARPTWARYNKSLDASGISGLVIDNLSVTWLFPAASTQPFGASLSEVLKMKYTLQKGVDLKQLKRVLPKRFQGLVDPRVANRGKGTVIIFGGENVIRSQQVQPILKELPDNEVVLAYAYNLTAESKDLLRARGVQIYTENDWHWTDGSYTDIRNHRSDRKL
jgi:hypothetical protein